MSLPQLKKILYVDDAQDLRKMVEVSLGRMGGYELKLCESGEAALVEVLSFAPDLMLLDVMMTGMSGPETLELMRQAPELANIPVIFMTSKATPEEIDNYKQLGAIEVIPKPFDPMQLPEKIQQVWQRHMANVAA